METTEVSFIGSVIHDNVTQQLATPTPPKDPMSIDAMVTLVIEATLMVIILVDNGLVMFVFARNRNLRRNITNYYILQLVISDFVTGVFTGFHITVQILPELLNEYYVCFARYCTMMIVCSISLLSILLITYDRFVAIVMPFYYRSNVSKKRVVLKCLIIDVIPIILCLVVPLIWKVSWAKTHEACLMVTIFPRQYLAGVVVPTFFFTVATKFVMYTIIFYKMSKRLDRAKKMVRGGCNQSHPQLERISQSNIALTKTGAIVLVSFTICWTPFIIYLIIQLFSDTARGAEFANTMSLATFMLILLNSALNPIIYVLRLSYFRRELRRAFSTASHRGDQDFNHEGSFYNNRSSHNSSTISGRAGVYYIHSHSLLQRGRRANRLPDNRRQSGENLLSSCRKRSEESVDSNCLLWRQLMERSSSAVDEQLVRMTRSISCPATGHSSHDKLVGYRDLLEQGRAKALQPMETILSSS